MPSLIATLGANISGFVQDLETAKGHARKSGEGIGSAFGEELTSKLKALGSAVAIEEFARRTIEWADSMGDLAIRTGLSVQQLQILENIGSKSGSSVEQLAGFYERLGKAMATAHKEGAGGQTAGALSRLGVSSETLESGDMGKAMSEVADHLQRAGDITPQVEADLAKIFKNAREAIPALKAMTEDAQVWEASLTVSTEKMAAMKGLSDHLKDAWHLISAAGKSFVGELAYGAESVIGNLSAIPRWGATFFETGSLEKANTAAINQLRKVADDRANLEKELSGQKPGKEPYAEVIDKNAEKEAERAQKTAEREADRAAKEAAREKEKADKEYERAQERAAKDARDKMAFKSHELDINSLQRSGFFVGGLSSAPEMVMLDVQKKSEQHLAQIKKGIDKLSQAQAASSGGDDTEY